MDSQYELTLWACCEFATPTVSPPCSAAVGSLWELQTHWKLTASSQCELIRMISQIAHSKLTVSVANSWKAHSKLTVWVILWVHCEVTECPKNELTLSFSVSSPWVSWELKFLTGLDPIVNASCQTIVLVYSGKYFINMWYKSIIHDKNNMFFKWNVNV